MWLLLVIKTFEKEFDVRGGVRLLRLSRVKWFKPGKFEG